MIQDALECLSVIKGSFGFVIYDSLSHRLLAARDVEGVQPMYWGSTREWLAWWGKGAGLLRLDLGLTSVLSCHSIIQLIPLVPHSPLSSRSRGQAALWVQRCRPEGLRPNLRRLPGRLSLPQRPPHDCLPARAGGLGDHWGGLPRRAP
jgi:hypothetical protein